MTSKGVVLNQCVVSSKQEKWAGLWLFLSVKHHKVSVVVVEIVIQNLNFLPGLVELHKLIIFDSRDQILVSGYEPARIEDLAACDVQCTLDLGHINSLSSYIAAVEPSELIYAVTVLVDNLVVGYRPLVVRKVIVVGWILHLSIRVHWAILHKFVIIDFQMIDQLYEKGSPSLAWVIVRKCVFFYVSAKWEHWVLNFCVKIVLDYTCVSGWIIDGDNLGALVLCIDDYISVHFPMLTWSVCECVALGLCRMPTPHDTNPTIVSLKPNVVAKIVVFYGDSCSTCLHGVWLAAQIAIDHLHGHRNMESITCPVSHVSLKLIVVDDDVRVQARQVTVPEVRILNVNHSTSRSNVLSKCVANKDYRPLISYDDEGCHGLNICNNQGVIKLFVRINTILEQVFGSPEIIYTDFELNVSRPNKALKLNIHFDVVKVILCFGLQVFWQQNLLDVSHVLEKQALLNCDRSWKAFSFEDETLMQIFSKRNVLSKWFRWSSRQGNIEPLQSLNDLVKASVPKWGTHDADVALLRWLFISDFCDACKVCGEVQHLGLLLIRYGLKFGVVDQAFAEWIRVKVAVYNLDHSSSVCSIISHCPILYSFVFVWTLANIT